MGKGSTRASQFVEKILQWCQEGEKQDKAKAALLRRADNPDTEYQCWELFLSFGVDIERPSRVIPYALVGAAIARARISSSGNLSFGEALARCFQQGEQGDAIRARFRRVLACESLEELRQILRPILSWLLRQISDGLDLVKLIHDLEKFSHSAEEVKRRWAKDFYSHLSQQNPF